MLVYYNRQLLYRPRADYLMSIIIDIKYSFFQGAKESV